MKIDDRLINYEISKQLPKSTPNATENIVEKQQHSGEQKAEGNIQLEQDTIVNLSPASKETKRINEIISSEPDLRGDKVSALKEKIETERYGIDHESVANKLVDAFIDEVI